MSIDDEECHDGISTEQRELKVVIRVEPVAECPINQAGPNRDVQNIRIQSKSHGTNCELELVETNDPSHQTLVSHHENVEHDCPCRTFEKHDLIPNIKAVGEDHYIVDVYISDRDDIRDLIIDLNDRSETVEILQITERTPESRSAPCELDTAVLTEKQHRALKAAIARGYYDPNETVTLAEIADSFGITRQAYSERLNTAENKLFSQIGERCLSERQSA